MARRDPAPRPVLTRPAPVLAAPLGVRWGPLALAALALAAVAVIATGIGAVAIPPDEVAGGIGRGLRGQLEGTRDTIVWRIRLPRVALAAMVGASLSLAGVAYQGIFRNPLADPYLLGVASGAGLGAAASIVLGAGVPLLRLLGLPLTAFAAALLAVALVVLLARRGGRIPTLHLVLAGVVLGSSCTAATSLLMLLQREQAAGVLAWLLGSLAHASWERVALLAPLLAVAAGTLALAGRALNLLQLGDEQAAQLGLPVERVKLTLIALATLATAAAVSVSGVIGFVGLVTPHAARLALGPDHRTLVPMSALLGAIFLILADLLARTVIAPAELPIGVVTALVGGPLFLWLLRRGEGA